MVASFRHAWACSCGIALGAALALSACGTLGRGDEKSREDSKKSVEQLIAECKDCPSERELDRAAKDDKQRAFVRRVNALEYAMTRRPLVGGNRVALLLDGPDTHQTQLGAIREARHHIHLITYIMTDDVLARQYLDALRERVQRGVKVRFMFDAMGSRTVSQRFRDELVEAGIEVRAYGAIDPREKEMPRVSRRHHRKILVVDGKVAFTGGINISDEYRASSAGSGNARGGWRDTHVQINGPGVKQFQQLFFESWEAGHEKIPNDDAYWPRLRKEGNDFVRAVTQNGNDLHDIALDPVNKLKLSKQEPSRETAVYGSYLAAIQSARQRIWITQAYFIPNEEFMEVLTAAARRGVEIRVLVPSTSDISLMVHASRYHYTPLLAAGGRVWEFSGPMLHAKTAVVDGVWSTVGSSNIDYRSFIHNDEANAIVIGHEFGEKMEQMYRDDLANAKEITREAWARRSWIERMRQRSAALLKYWI